MGDRESNGDAMEVVDTKESETHDDDNDVNIDMEEEMKKRKQEEEKQDESLEAAELRYTLYASAVAKHNEKLGRDQSSKAGESIGMSVDHMDVEGGASLIGKTKEEVKEIRNQLLQRLENLGAVAYFEEMVYKSQLAYLNDPKGAKAWIARVKATNEEKLKELDEKVKDAEEKHGPVEVVEANVNRATFLGFTTTPKEALKTFSEINTKSISSGKRIDLTFQRIKIGLFWKDVDIVKQEVVSARAQMEEGGDWERRNRLKVYEGLLGILYRDFSQAFSQLLGCLATFQSYDICSFNNFVIYAVLTSLVALQRVDLKSKVIDAPEVVSVLLEHPSVSSLLHSFYDCRYHDFFAALLEIEPIILRDRFMAQHIRWFFRELRIKAYAQFLEPYKSVTVASMANSFGVGVEFIDKEVSQFIASKRLVAKIDKVEGVIRTERADTRNAHFNEIIRNGDGLLNKLQKLSRAINA